MLILTFPLQPQVAHTPMYKNNTVMTMVKLVKKKKKLKKSHISTDIAKQILTSLPKQLSQESMVKKKSVFVIGICNLLCYMLFGNTVKHYLQLFNNTT